MYEGEWVKNRKEGKGRAIVNTNGVQWEYEGSFCKD